MVGGSSRSRTLSLSAQALWVQSSIISQRGRFLVQALLVGSSSRSHTPTLRAQLHVQALLVEGSSRSHAQALLAISSSITTSRHRVRTPARERPHPVRAQKVLQSSSCVSSNV